MDQILADAKSLAQRLQYHDSAADSLISDAANLQTKLHGMKEVEIFNLLQNYFFRNSFGHKYFIRCSICSLSLTISKLLLSSK